MEEQRERQIYKSISDTFNLKNTTTQIVCLHFYKSWHARKSPVEDNANSKEEVICQPGAAFPNVCVALRMFLTLLVTNCHGECSFSHRVRIKNDLRT